MDVRSSGIAGQTQLCQLGGKDMKCMYNIPCKNRRLQIRKIRYYHHYSKRTALPFYYLLSS
jgi:hypothetical protein